jgi:hypothetical protein
MTVTSETGDRLRARIRNALRDAGHDGCSGLGGASWEPVTNVISCGCGFQSVARDGWFTLGDARLQERQEAKAVGASAPDDVTSVAEAVLAGRYSDYEDMGPDDTPWPPPEERPDAEVTVMASWPGSEIRRDVTLPPVTADQVMLKPPVVSPVTALDPIAATLALIDPSQIYTPGMLEERVLDVLARLERGAVFERQTIINAYEKKAAFDHAFMRAMVRQDAGSADMRKARAMMECEQEHLALIEADMLKESAKSTMHNLRGVLSGYQSVTRSVGLDYQAGGARK